MSHGQRGTLEEYMANSNEKVLVLPQCETVECLESIEEVVALDGWMASSSDLSTCLSPWNSR